MEQLDWTTSLMQLEKYMWDITRTLERQDEFVPFMLDTEEKVAILHLRWLTTEIVKDCKENITSSLKYPEDVDHLNHLNLGFANLLMVINAATDDVIALVSINFDGNSKVC